MKLFKPESAQVFNPDIIISRTAKRPNNRGKTEAGVVFIAD